VLKYVYEEVYKLRTNIVLDEELVRKAFKLSSARTKKELVHEALEELISTRSRRDLRDLRGKIAFAGDYDHKKLRKGA
jgi:Arc/MetJ family transcription regulator